MKFKLLLGALVLLLSLGCDDGSSVSPAQDLDGDTVDGSGGSGGTDQGIEDPDTTPVLPDVLFEDAQLDAADAQVDVPDAEPEENSICEACEEDADCSPEGSICIDGFCGTPCDTDEDCPEGDYLCQDADGVSQCIPESGFCPGASICTDLDGDGYGDGQDCAGIDCDDDNPDVNPGIAADLCDGVDNDCDDQIDEDFVVETCGEGVCMGTNSCNDGEEVPCVEGSPTGSDANCDGIDDNCDGTVDEDYVPTTCGVGVCFAESSCADGVVQECIPGDPISQFDENCDGVDDNCSGTADEDYTEETCGIGACEVVGVCMEGNASCEPAEPAYTEDTTCDGVDEDCDGSVDEEFVSETVCGIGVCTRNSECTDGEEVCTPGLPVGVGDSTCDGLDDDCDGMIDEECNQNSLIFNVAGGGAEFIDVALVYDQQWGENADIAAHQGRPSRSVSVQIGHPRGLNLKERGDDSMECPLEEVCYICQDWENSCFEGNEVCKDPCQRDKGVVNGTSMVLARRRWEVTHRRSDPDETNPHVLMRMIVADISENPLRVEPGVMAVLRFTHSNLPGPFPFFFPIPPSFGQVDNISQPVGVDTELELP